MFTLSYVNTALNQSAFRIHKYYIIKWFEQHGIVFTELPHYPTVIVKERISSAVLSWSIPDSGDEAIEKYYVRYWKTKRGRISQKMFESVATAGVIVPNLLPYTEYQLEISGVSDLGEGLARVSQFKTLETGMKALIFKLRSNIHTQGKVWR